MISVEGLRSASRKSRLRTVFGLDCLTIMPSDFTEKLTPAICAGAAVALLLRSCNLAVSSLPTALVPDVQYSSNDIRKVSFDARNAICDLCDVLLNMQFKSISAS